MQKPSLQLLLFYHDALYTFQALQACNIKGKSL